MLKCLYLQIHVYLAEICQKSISVRTAFLLLPFKTRAQHWAWFENVFSAVSLQNKSSTLSMSWEQLFLLLPFKTRAQHWAWVEIVFSAVALQNKSSTMSISWEQLFCCCPSKQEFNIEHESGRIKPVFKWSGVESRLIAATNTNKT